MEEKSWIWTMNSLSEGSQNSIYCINVLPLVILKEGNPFKLIYTDQTGKLSTVFSPGLDDLEKSLKQSLHPSQDPELKCIQLSGQSFSVKLSKLSSVLPNKEILAIQGTKERLKVYKHNLDFAQGFYTSSLCMFKVSAWVPIDDIALEKFFLVCSINCISLLEKKLVNLNSFTTCFIRDRLGKFWVEGFSPCNVFRLNVARQSILNCKIVISSNKVFREPGLSRTQSFDCSAVFSAKVKPRLEVRKTKILRFLPSFTQKFRKPENVCFGTYCELEVVPERITKHRKVEAWKFYTLPHDLIRRVVKQIEFPVKEKTFAKIFHSCMQSENNSQLKNLKNRNNNDSIMICPTCYIILQVMTKLGNSLKS